MKKLWSNESIPWYGGNSKKLLLKQILSFTLFICFTFISNQSFSQEKSISLNFSNISIRQVLNYIEDNSEYDFIYSDNIFNDQAQIEKIKAEGETIVSVLDKLFKGTNYSYKIIDNQIAIFDKQEDTPEKSLKQKENRIIKGQVQDAKSSLSLPGVSIVLKGTMQGTITDINGYFSMETAIDNPILVFSFIGFKPIEFKVKEKYNILVKMEEDVAGIDEVVVIGYGIQKKSDLTGSVAVVDMADVGKSGATSLDRALQGKAAGVQISNVSGQPGAGVSIKIRGVGSISMSSEPLYIIDGLPVSGSPGGFSPLSGMNPSDIGSIQILKDASATAIYGARGANGVVLITTKMGKLEEPQIEFSSSFGLSTMPHTYDVMGADQYGDFMSLAYENKGIDDAKNPAIKYYSKEARTANNNENTDTDFQDALTQVGTKNVYNLSISKGGEKSRFFVSGSYTDEVGILVNTGMKRYTLRANSDWQITKRIKVGETISMNKTTLDRKSHSTRNPWRFASMASPLMPLYDENAIGGYGGLSTDLVGNNERPNTVAEQMLNENTSNIYNVMTSFYADVDLFEGLKFTFRFGADYLLSDDRKWSPSYTIGDPDNIFHLSLRDNNTASLTQSNWNTQNYLMSSLLSYNKKIGNHSINSMVAFERINDVTTKMSVLGNNFEDERYSVLDQAIDIGSVTGVKTEHRMESYLGRIIYDFKNKYLLTASLRVDGSSRFGPLTNRFGYFPSFSAGWKINEDFLQSCDDINILKLRVGWGQTGNENLGDYMFNQTLDPKKNTRYTFGEGQDEYTAFMEFMSVGNPLIRWEATEMTNVGVDLVAFDNKLEFTAEYYVKNQKDMLVSRSISSIYGKLNNPHGFWPTTGAWVNLGSIRNQGMDLSLAYKNNDGAIKYSISGNFSSLKNEVRDLDIPPITTDWTTTAVGHPISSFYGYVADGILQEDDFYFDESSDKYILNSASQSGLTEPGDIKYKDINHDGIINDNDRTVIGKPFPDYMYGLNVNANYKGIDISVYFQGVQNVEVYNEVMSYIGIGTDRDNKDNNKLISVLEESWTAENASTTMTRAYPSDPNNNARVSSWFVEDASYLKIRTLQIGYSLPEAILQKIKIADFRLYLNINNLLTITKYSGYDPDITSVTDQGQYNPLYGGVDFGIYPVPKSYSLGLQLKF